MPDLPTGTVTFLFTDIEGSTRLLQHLGDQWKGVVEQHQQLLRTAFQARGAHEIRTEGDSFFIVFARATDAVAAAVAGQRALAEHAWPEGAQVRVRMGLNTGEPKLGGGDYVGLDVHRAARISAAGYGGQILLSASTRELVQHDLPEGVSLRELGAHRLKDLQHAELLFQVVIAELPAEYPPLKTLEGQTHNLPVQLTPFLGREQELAAVRERLLQADVRLLTLTGPGGTGKTRLGLQAAADLIDAFRDGVFFVELAAVRDPDRVASTVAHVLGVREGQGQSLMEALKEHLRTKQLLLVLDNFEQILTAAPLVTELLGAAPRLKVLITSRAVLRLRGEHEFPVPPLALPDPKRLPSPEQLSQYAAVALFIQRAVAARPEFAVTNENAPAVAAICHRLEGLPLAIELAAARVKLFSPEALLARLESRLKLLTGGARDLPARQQTLRNAIDWSYDLLEEAEKQLFQRLSVFVGGCTVEAAEVVCNSEGDHHPLRGYPIDVLDGITALVNQSLLRQEETSEGEGRFRMLESVREYAAERLGEGEAGRLIHRNHADWFLQFARNQVKQMRTLKEVAAIKQFDAELENVRGAMDWAVQSDPERLGAEIALELGAYLERRGFLGESLQRLQQGLAAAEQAGAVATALYARLLKECASVHLDRFEWNAACHRASQALLLAEQQGDCQGMGEANNLLGLAAHGEADFAEARQRLSLALTQYEQAGDRVGVAKVHNNLGRVAYEDPQGSQEEAAQHWQETLHLHRENGDQRGIAETLTNLGAIAQERGLLKVAGERYHEALHLFLELQDPFGVGRALSNMGEVAELEGDLHRASFLFAAAETLFREVGSPYQTFTGNLLRSVAARLGDADTIITRLRDQSKGQPLAELVTWALAASL
jgi:predicted ATPase/class 3 adenylate cyclase